MPQGTTPTVSEVNRAQSRAVGGKRDRCRKGKSCSATCIDPNETCLVEFPNPVSSSIGKARDRLSESPKQEKTWTESEIKTFNKIRDDYKDRMYVKVREAISSSHDTEYRKLRSEIIEFNQNLIEQGVYGKHVPPVKVPLEWGRVMKIKRSYRKALGSVEDSLDRAGYLRDKASFDKNLAKMQRMHLALGVKLGDKDESRYYKWEDYKGNTLVHKLYKENIKGVNILPYSEDLFLDAKVGKNKIRVEVLNRGTKFTFKVNGGYEEDPDMTREEKMAIAYKVKDIFSRVVKNMNEGSVIEVSPYDGDGKGQGRKQAYLRYGFKEDPGSRDLLGIVRGGKLKGATVDDLETFLDSDRYNFKEVDREVALFYQMLWGSMPR